MDETIKRLLIETSNKTGVDLDRVKDIVDFQNDKLFELLKNHQEHDIAEIRIPYLCRFQFKQQYYDKFNEKLEKSKLKT
jgi:hypothetical protein